MDIVALVEIILGFVAIVAIGWVLRRLGLLVAEDARPINNIIIYVGLPALIFRAVHPAALEPSLAVVALLAWAIFTVTALLAWGLSRALRLSRPTAGAFILTAAFGNTGYIGYPVSLALLGDEGLVRAIFYDVFGTVGALLFVGLFIAQRMGSATEPDINPIREALAFPAVIALIAALVLRPVPIPNSVSSGLDVLASLVVPLIMISVGLSLKPGGIREHAVPLGVLAGVRLVAAPLIAVAICSLVVRDPDVMRLVVLEAGMPSMMLTLVVALRFKLDVGFVASAILVTTLASALSIPLMQALAG